MKIASAYPGYVPQRLPQPHPLAVEPSPATEETAKVSAQDKLAQLLVEKRSLTEDVAPQFASLDPTLGNNLDLRV